MAAPLENKLNAMLGMTAEELDALGEAYENDEVTFSSADEVRDGSPLDYIGSKRETFVVDAVDYRRAKIAAQMQGCTKSDVYRAALRTYLDGLHIARA